MNIAIDKLEEGKTYLVKHRDTFKKTESRTTRRIFKWKENRFGSIPCLVFTSRVSKDVKGRKDGDDLIISSEGSSLPCSEISIPTYDVINISSVS